ncbi:hypothetical protein ACSBR1_025440 [Camellia fascicularis]
MLRSLSLSSVESNNGLSSDQKREFLERYGLNPDDFLSKPSPKTRRKELRKTGRGKQVPPEEPKPPRETHKLLQIRHREAVGIIGPSGTGKSTILKIMAGLLTPDKGEVFIRGRRRHGLISDDEISGLRIGMVFQSAALFDSLTVRENVGFLLYENSSMSENQIAILVSQTLVTVGLKGVEDRLPSELSGGMKKRVALARSIIFDITKDVIEPEEEDLGTISLGILYSSFAVFSLVASLVVRFLGSKNALILGNTGYWLFIAANLIPTW